MSTVQDKFALLSTNNTWKDRLLDFTDPENPVSVDLTNVNKVYIIFTKPDGTQFPTDEQILDDFDQGAVLVTPASPTNTDIKFENLESPSILDLINGWSYFAAATFGDIPTLNYIKSPVKIPFWVS